jgi:hypothetical protein
MQLIAIPVKYTYTSVPQYSDVQDSRSLFHSSFPSLSNAFSLSRVSLTVFASSVSFLSHVPLSSSFLPILSYFFFDLVLPLWHSTLPLRWISALHEVNMNITLSWDTKPFTLVDMCQPFGRTCISAKNTNLTLCSPPWEPQTVSSYSTIMLFIFREKCFRMLKYEALWISSNDLILVSRHIYLPCRLCQRHVFTFAFSNLIFFLVYSQTWG